VKNNVDQLNKNKRQRPAQFNLERECAIWTEKKVYAGVVAQRLHVIGKKARYHRMKDCADTIISDVCGKCEARYIIRTNFCRDRLCPVCSWRRSRRLTQRLGEITTANEAEKHSRYILLTLTVRNIPWAALAEQIEVIMESWRRMEKRIKRAAAVTGWVRTFEVKRSHEHGDAHPHLHILLQVPPEYFDKDSGIHYHKKDDLIQQWKKCLHADYAPSISINAVKDADYGIGRAVAAAARYIGKVSGFEGLSDTDFRYYVEAVHGVRTWATGGRMRIGDDKEIEAFLHDDGSGYAEGFCKHCGGKLYEMREVWSVAGKTYSVKSEMDYNNLTNRTQAGSGQVVNINNSRGGIIYVGGFCGERTESVRK
jgi:plasmid rolling circle replication initiator protein Rep